jgi:hypothetical protein
MLKYAKKMYPQLSQLRLVEIADPDLQLELVKYEKQDLLAVSNSYKFGVLYVAEGQVWLGA